MRYLPESISQSGFSNRHNIPKSITLTCLITLNCFFTLIPLVHAGDIVATVRNLAGSNQPNAYLMRHSSTWTFLDDRSADANGIARWTNISSGTYNLQAYWPNATHNLNELWEQVSVVVPASGVTNVLLARRMPYASHFRLMSGARNVTGNIVPSGTVIRVETVLTSLETASFQARSIVWFDRTSNLVGGFVTTNTAQLILSGQTLTQAFTRTVNATGNYFRTLRVQTDTGGGFLPTDAWAMEHMLTVTPVTGFRMTNSYIAITSDGVTNWYGMTGAFNPPLPSVITGNVVQVTAGDIQTFPGGGGFASCDRMRFVYRINSGAWITNNMPFLTNAEGDQNDKWALTNTLAVLVPGNQLSFYFQGLSDGQPYQLEIGDGNYVFTNFERNATSPYSINVVERPIEPFSLQGIVRDRFSGGQVPGATVEARWIQGSSWTVVAVTNTDDNGHYSITNLSNSFQPIEVVISKIGYADESRSGNPNAMAFLSFALDPQTSTPSRFTETINNFKDVWFEFPPASPNVIRIHNNRDLYFGVQITRIRGGVESTILPASTANILGPKKYWLFETSVIEVTDPDPQIGDTYEVLLMHGDANGGPDPVVQHEVMEKNLEQVGRAIAGETLKQMGRLYPSEVLLNKTKAFWDAHIFIDAISDSVRDGTAFPFADAVVKKVFTSNKLYEQVLGLTSDEAALFSGSVRVLTVMPRFLDQIEHSSYRQARPHAYQYLALQRVAGPYAALSLYTTGSGGGENNTGGYQLPSQLYFNVDIESATRRLTNIWAVVDLYDPLGTLVESTQLPVQNSLLGRTGAIQLTQQGQILEAGETMTFRYVAGAPIAFSAPAYAEGDYLLTAKVFENGYPGQVDATQIGPTISQNLHFDDLAAPQPPETVTARRIDNGWVALSWDKITANMEWGPVYDMDKYEIWRRVGAGTSQFLAFVDVDPLQGEPKILIDSNCTASSTYAYKVRAIDLDGRVGPFGNEAIVNSNKLPSAVISSPTNNAVFQAGTIVNISIAASDLDGTISQVASYLGDDVLQVFTQTPYNVSWSALSQGVFVISAQAWDDQWMSSTYGAVNVSVVGQPILPVVTYSPDPPVCGQQCTISYNSVGRNLASVNPVRIHLGFNNWSTVISSDPAMAGSPGGIWTYTFPVTIDHKQIDCVFTDGSGTWDNNNNADWHTSTFLSLPTAPSGVSATTTYVDHVRISWNAVANATGYQIWRSTANNSGTATRISPASGVASPPYDDMTAIPGTIYYYWAKATNWGGVSGFSVSDSGYAIDTLLDTDGDGMSDWAENIAGTNPDNSQMYFRVMFPATSALYQMESGVVLQWQSASNRLYRVDRSTNLEYGFNQIIATNIPATPPLNTHTDHTANGANPAFYKVGVGME